MKPTFIIIVFLIITSCQQETNQQDKTSSDIIENYKDKGWSKVNSEQKNEWDYKNLVWIVSNRDTLTNKWICDNAAEHLEINLINDTTIEYSFRYMDISNGGLQHYKGKAYTSLNKSNLEMNKRGNQFFYVREYIVKEKNHGIIIRLDTIWQMYAQVNLYEF